MKFVYLLVAIVTLENGDNMVLHRAVVESKPVCYAKRGKFETIAKKLEDVDRAKAYCLKIHNTEYL